MKLRFRESAIRSWAGKYSYSREEMPLLNLQPVIQRTGYMTKEQLRLVAQWKAPRSAGHIEKNDEDYIREITSISFSEKMERTRIEVLTLLDGIRWPTASVVLHLFHEDPYPIIDFRALWSVKAKMPGQYSFSFWWSYVEFCRAVARRNSVDMRTLDRALWQYSKEKQKT